MTNKPFFSIMIPVYNVEKYVSRCIESVLAQTFQNYEVIVVDDGSTDKSGQIIDSFIDDSRVRIYHKSNSGLLSTRRFALAKCTGKYYIALDSDDYLAETALEIVYNTITTYNSDCVIYGFRSVWKDKTISITHDDSLLTLCDKRDIYMKCLSDGNYNAIWRKAYKAELIDGRDYSQFIHIDHGEDLLQSIEILENSTIVTFIPDILYCYSANPMSMTRNRDPQKYTIDYTVRDKVLEMLKNEPTIQDNDIDTYREQCQKYLYYEICRILNFRCSNSLKIDYLQQHYDNLFCKSFIFSKKISLKMSFINRMILRLFASRRFETLLVIGHIKKLLNR